MQWKALIAFVVVAGCSPVPVHVSCALPKFRLEPSFKAVEVFPKKSSFGEACAIETPRSFSVSLDDGSSHLDVLIQGEWVRLRAKTSEGVKLDISAKGIRSESVPDYSYSVRADSLIDGVLVTTVTAKDGLPVATTTLRFELTECTCTYFDAI